VADYLLIKKNERPAFLHGAQSLCWVSLRISPSQGMFNEPLFYLRPVMQVGRIEIGIVRPYQRSNFRIQSNLEEYSQILKGTIDFPMQNRIEVNGLLGTVVKADA
jgi:hypothetical protein